MKRLYHKTFQQISNSGIHISSVTVAGGYRPFHWHEEVELLFLLNGEADVIIEGQKYQLPQKQLLVIESCQVHSTHISNERSMFLCIHLSRSQLREYMPDLEFYQLNCSPLDRLGDRALPYEDLCRQMEQLTRTYILDTPAHLMEAEGMILQIFARLIRYFSTREALPETESIQAMERIRDVIDYTSEHFREPMSLQDISDYLGLNKAYFCRFFKRNMGVSYLQYLNEVRLAHIYHDLLNTDHSVAMIMEENGFTNQKLFNRCFKAVYGKTPTAVRRRNQEIPFDT